jgi:hypothetical protein
MDIIRRLNHSQIKEHQTHNSYQQDTQRSIK